MGLASCKDGVMTTSRAFTTRRLTGADAGELMTVRRAAFVTEAQACADPFIPALTETLAEIRADLNDEDVVTLAMFSGTRMVGSVRLQFAGENDKVYLGRFAVVPDMQGRGLGMALLHEAAAYVNDGQEVWIFTGQNRRASVGEILDESVGSESSRLTLSYLRRLFGEEQARAILSMPPRGEGER